MRPTYRHIPEGRDAPLVSTIIQRSKAPALGRVPPTASAIDSTPGRTLSRSTLPDHPQSPIVRWPFAAPPAPHPLANTQEARQKAISKHRYFKLPYFLYGTLRKKRPTQPCEPFDNFKPTISTKSKRGSALHYGADPLKHRNTPRTRRANQRPIRLSPGRTRRQSPCPYHNTYSRPNDQRTPLCPLVWPAVRTPHIASSCARR